MFSEIKFGYGVNGWKSEKDGQTVGDRAAARTFGGQSLLLARMLLDKDNPVLSLSTPH
jgi:hypothetical protein